MVAAGSFGIFALLVSYLRYREMLLISMDHAEKVLTAPAAVMLILQNLRKKKQSADLTILRFEGFSRSDPGGLRDFLRGNLRKEDGLLQLENGPVLAVLNCPGENLQAAALRLVPLIEKAGFTRGIISMWVPELDAEKILEWMVQRPVSDNPEGWIISPPEWKPEKSAPGNSTAVDPLTGVLKADRIMLALRRMLAEQRRHGRKMTLVCVDVDGLAAYNAAYGQETGDRIVQKTATLLMENCRETDLIGRIGGNTFILGMPGRDEDLFAAAQRMSDVIRNSSLTEGDRQIRFSAAFGLASLPRDGRGPAALMECADLALKEAKRRGRGMCLSYQPSFKQNRAGSTAPEHRPEIF